MTIATSAKDLQIYHHFIDIGHLLNICLTSAQLVVNKDRVARELVVK